MHNTYILYYFYLNYYRAHQKSRVKIEQVNGQLKNKFPCLSKGICLTPAYACDIIVACVVLFNISKDLKERDHSSGTEQPDNIVEEEQEDGVSTRARIVHQFFT
jgi:hypothetical protein